MLAVDILMNNIEECETNEERDEFFTKLRQLWRDNGSSVARNIRHCTTVGKKSITGMDLGKKCKPLKESAQKLINNINPYAIEE